LNQEISTLDSTAVDWRASMQASTSQRQSVNCLVASSPRRADALSLSVITHQRRRELVLRSALLLTTSETLASVKQEEQRA